MTNTFNKKFIIIAGATGVGKTDIAIELAQRLNGAIINADMGQLYTPLTIGTAKPHWFEQAVPHYLFDVVNDPIDYNVIEYRSRAFQSMEAIWQHNQIPFVVGGSHFYIQSLFFPPSAKAQGNLREEDILPLDQSNLWQYLHEIDPERAKQIHQNDTYRLKRALHIWHTTKQKPSSFAENYQLSQPCILIFLTRDREELYNRIDLRTQQMLQSGWIDEVRALLDTPWESFLLEKKIIGYDDIIRYLKSEQTTSTDYNELVAIIARKTRNYAKRQLTYWRMLEKKIMNMQAQNIQPTLRIATFNLTLLTHDLYINQLATFIMKEI